MRFRQACLSLLAVVASTGHALAHPGHALEAGDSHSLTHYVTQPDHLAWWVVVAAAISCACLLVRWAIIRAAAKRLKPAYAPVRKRVR